jgi:hypothetical protein
MSSVGAHWPTNTLALCFPIIWSVADTPMAVTAAQRNVSDGHLAVCDSMDFAICPSVCSLRTADAIAMSKSPGLCRDERPRRDGPGTSPFLSTCAPVDAVPPCRFRLRNLSRGDFERRSNDLETIRYANDFTAVTRELFRRASEATLVGGSSRKAIRLSSPRWRSMLRCRRGGTHGEGRSRSTSSHRTRARAPDRRCERSTCP